MNNDVSTKITARLAKAEEALDLAKLAIEKGYWNSAASRLYYACFYFITALFEKNDIKTHTHAAVKRVFGLQFIKEGKVDAKWGRLLTNLFDMKQEGDYEDFVVLTQEDILPLLKEVEEFRVMIMKLL